MDFVKLMIRTKWVMVNLDNQIEKSIINFVKLVCTLGVTKYIT